MTAFLEMPGVCLRERPSAFFTLGPSEFYKLLFRAHKLYQAVKNWERKKRKLKTFGSEERYTMLTAIIKINSIDYENTLQHIFPVVSEKLMAINSKKMVIRLFQQLGDAALPVLIGVISRLPEDTKNELLIRGLNAYSSVLKEKLNEELQKDKWGQCFTIGVISADQRESILLNIGQIKVDYQKLLKNEQVSEAVDNRLGRWSPLVKKAAKVAASFAEKSVEQMGLNLLQQESNQKRLMELVRRRLDKLGIGIDVDNIQIIQAAAITEDVIEVTDSLSLTEKMENDIISALAGYLRENVTDGITVAE